MKLNRILYHLGNVLILFSIAVFAYTFYPLLIMYLFPALPPPNIKIVNKGFYLSIPKIHAYSNIIAAVDPWNRTVYESVLKKGVAQAKGSALPNEKGSVFLFAHSTGLPWELTRENTVFLRLGELNKDDYILIDYKSKRYIYKVVNKLEVWPSNTQYLKNINIKDGYLILQTCTPIGTSLKRLLIFARKY
jgi:LPXTG-site transpeptidase (sortase) family protein